MKTLARWLVGVPALLLVIAIVSGQLGPWKLMMLSGPILLPFLR